ARSLTDPLRQALRTRLPAHLLPARLVRVDALPLTPNGKLDRAALPAPGDHPPRTTAPAGPAPASPLEQQVADLFSRLLGATPVRPGDDFFDLGGDSLHATRLAAALRAAHHADIDVRDIFEHPTVAALAARLATPADTPAAPGAPAPRPERIPLSPAQRRLWFLHHHTGADRAYNVPLTIRLTGDLDRTALTAALGDLTDRHEVLRTVIEEHDGSPHQRVLPPDEGRPRLVETAVDPAELPARLTRAARHPFRLDHETPLRASLFTTGPGRPRTLLLLLHHIACDHASLGTLTADLETAYTARLRGVAPTGLPPLPYQYADFALDRAARPDPSTAPLAHDDGLAHWTRALEGLPDRIALPVDRTAQPTDDGAVAEFRIPPALHRRLARLAATERASLFMVVHTALTVLLTRLGAGQDIPVATAVADRPDPRLDASVGFYVNTLVLRTDTSGDPTFRELLARVRTADLDAFAHQDVPFERVVEALAPHRPENGPPLFQVMLVLTPPPPERLDLPGLRAEVATVPTGTAKCDLAFSLYERRGATGDAEGLDGTLEYRTSLFTPDTARALGERLVRLLTRFAEAPDTPIGAADLLAPEERALLLDHWSRTPARPPPPPHRRHHGAP
ncbi:condensation domain-containing protein, partial [Streptomyces sp. OfavH-34-F]|uniref:condensation domain-containing protein n=1 Tax=Streptomyces sp. OfavH-34-F TaxID=2917760 RepID=UPI001EF36AA6